MKSWLPFLVCLPFGIQNGIGQPKPASDTTAIAFVNVAVVSMQDEEVLRGQAVIIRGDRIESIGPVDAQSIPPGARVIDGSGRYLIPGLADMHVHVHAPFANGPLFLNAGVTTALSLGTRASAGTVALAWQKVLEERERSRMPGFMGPTLYTVGRQIWGGETPEEAERIVQENVEGGYDFLKVHGDVSPDTFIRLNETASRLGIRVTGHATGLRVSTRPGPYR